jgi:predicted ATPase
VEKSLKGDGANLSSVLYDLCAKKKGKERVLAFIRSLPEQDIRDIDFLETPRNEVMLQLTESFGGRRHAWDAGVLSDGTLRVLAVAAALLSAPEGSLVIIEEIDNGVHPSRAGTLLDNIETIARERNVRVLVTTHNPALLDALPTSAIPDVVCCYRDPELGDSRLLRLEELRDYPEVIAQGPLGWLDGFPDHAVNGISLADLSIIREFERQCELHRLRRVFVWSFDGHLNGYDRASKERMNAPTR